jgi:protein-disulfide isomerase
MNLSKVFVMNTHTQRGSAALWGIFLVVIVGVIVAAVLYGRQQGETQTPAELLATQSEILAIQPDDNLIGDSEAPVVIIEYSDFQCPACANAYPIIKQAIEQFDPMDVVFAYRHLPLRQIHPNADLAARAAEAAGIQGAFYPMHDLLFDNQADWSGERNPRDTFVGYAESLGLDVDQFANDLISEEVRSKVNRHYDEAETLLGARLATPTVYLNGQRLSGSELGNLEGEIATALEEAMTNPQAESTEAAPVNNTGE